MTTLRIKSSTAQCAQAPTLRGRERGSILLVALIFLAILTFAAATTMRTSTMGMRMAGNEQTRVNTLQLAQSIVDEVVTNPDNVVVSGDTGYINCTANVDDCTANTVAISQDIVATADASKASVIVERLAPALTPAPRGINSSADAFFAARFQVDATYDGTADNEGRAGVVQGVIVLVPRSAQSN